jgi:hypothetical protein
MTSMRQALWRIVGRALQNHGEVLYPESLIAAARPLLPNGGVGRYNRLRSCITAAWEPLWKPILPI